MNSNQGLPWQDDPEYLEQQQQDADAELQLNMSIHEQETNPQ